jgi:hypothetical protein
VAEELTTGPGYSGTTPASCASPPNGCPVSGPSGKGISHFEQNLVEFKELSCLPQAKNRLDLRPRKRFLVQQRLRKFFDVGPVVSALAHPHRDI